MSRIKRCAMLLAYLFIALGPAWADVNVEAVAQTPLKFYQAVNGKDYVTAWNLLTEESKNRLSTMVAEEAKMPVPDVRALFDASDNAVKDGFWESFRESSKPEVYVGFTYKYLEAKDGVYVVQASLPEAKDGQPLDLFVKDENGYKFGLAETYKF